jgi:tetratricopeptide (TPR) repeat protein
MSVPAGSLRALALAMMALALTGCATAFGRGEAALHAGRPDEAARYFGEALAADPGRLDARVGLGIARFRTRAWDAAIAALDDVVAEAPRRADARLYLGLARLMHGDVAAAREQLVALRGLPIHARIAAQLDRMLPLLVPGLDATVRDLVAADLDDAYQWATELDRARRTARAPLEPAWTIFWDHSYPSTLYGPYRGVLPSAP